MRGNSYQIDMLNRLFASKVQFEALNRLFQENHPLSTSELVEKTGKRQPNIAKELDKLVTEGLLIMERDGHQNYYAFHSQNSYVPLLKALFEEYRSHQKKYICINEEGNVGLLPLGFFPEGFLGKRSKEAGIMNRLLESFAYFRNNYLKYYVQKETFFALAKESLAKLLTDPSFVHETIGPVTKQKGEEALRLFETLQEKKSHLAPVAAEKILNQIQEIVLTQIDYGLIAVFDLKEIYSHYLESYLKERVRTKKDITLSSALSKLLQPPECSLTQCLRMELLDGALQKLQSKKFDAAPWLQQLQSRWFWLNYGYRGPGLPLDYFEQVFKELCENTKPNLEKERKTLASYARSVEEEKECLFRELAIDERHQEFIRALSTLSFLKVYRKDIAFLCIAMLFRVLEPYKKNLTERHLAYLTLDESIQLVRGELQISKETLLRREEESVYIIPGEKILLGREARRFKESLEEKEEEQIPDRESIRLLNGTTACLGETGNWIHGKVSVINHPEDMEKMEDGDILISNATTPELLPVMRRASAIVTDMGGITCHAAIVSRELNIPCLVGTQYATKLFRDQDRVIVCPRHGHIKFQE